MGAHDGGLFDRTTIDMGETSAGAIAVQQVCQISILICISIGIIIVKSLYWISVPARI
jgi:hypothetical protein